MAQISKKIEIDKSEKDGKYLSYKASSGSAFITLGHS
jgi:hypothetical protein